jgi:hypothetical protein
LPFVLIAHCGRSTTLRHVVVRNMLRTVLPARYHPRAASLTQTFDGI